MRYLIAAALILTATALAWFGGPDVAVGYMVLCVLAMVIIDLGHHAERKSQK